MTGLPEPAAAIAGNRVEQTNHQTLHVHVHNVVKGMDRAGCMAGTALREEGAIPLANCEVQLFFGPVGEHPVATTHTDPDGAFAFDDLPPGFYGLRLFLPGSHLVLLHNLRVNTGETCQPRVLLTGQQLPPRFASRSERADADLAIRSLVIDNPA